ncbi:MAG: DUF1570 domain-containing protein [Phycisphaeraceae bacterium]
MRHRLTILLLTFLTTLTASAPGQSPSEQTRLEHARQTALENPHQAISLYRNFLRKRPAHRQAYRELWALSQEHGMRDTPGLLTSLAEEFPDGTHLRTSDHFLIVYDMPHAWADTRVRLLEQVHDAFYEQLIKAGFQPLPLHERLVCILFASHDDYLAYARQIGVGAMENTGGFYTSAANRVVFFSNRANPQLRQHGQRLEQMRRQIQQLRAALAEAEQRGDVSRAQNLRNRRIRALQALTQLENQYNAAIGRGNMSQTLHEAAHLLAFNSGIQDRRRAYPLWVSEGLATAFETTNPARPFGPGHDNPSRRHALTEAFNNQRVRPLADLIALRATRDIRPAERGAVYAQMWGMFHFLWTHHLEALRDHLQAIASGELRTGNAEANRQAFEQSFGDLEPLERQWREYVRAMTQPSR